MWPFRRSGAGDAAGPAPVSIDVAEAFARSKRGAKLVDVRSVAEFRALHPKGARNVSPDLISRDETGLARDAELLVICLSGHRSQHQARKLVELGYTNVANVHGGLNAWKKAGLPVKR
jgi:sulfur-carrier protein adenylyltransferase/sulfurtransferase